MSDNLNDQNNKDNTIEEEKEIKEELKSPEFTEYIQCFKNKNTQELMNDPKYAALSKTHKFWDTQPVLKPGEVAQTSGPLQQSIAIDLVPKELTKLPENFTWREIDLMNELDIKDIYQLLYENYVEDDDGQFRFNYSTQFLRWALLPPE